MLVRLLLYRAEEQSVGATARASVAAIRLPAGDAEAREALLELGFNLFILMQYLMALAPQHSGKVAAALAEAHSCESFAHQTGHIEIMRDGRLQHVYFRIPSYVSASSHESVLLTAMCAFIRRFCAYLMEAEKQDLLQNVVRTTPTNKLQVLARSLFLYSLFSL